MNLPSDPFAESGDAIMPETGDFPGLPRIFADCVDSDGPPPIDSPWVDRDFVYAADCAIIVRAPVDAVGVGTAIDYAKRSGQEYPDVVLVWRMAARKDRVPTWLPASCREPKVPCPECCGVGHCAWCGGSGRVKDRRPVALAGLHFSACYVALLVRNGVKKLWVPPGPPADRNSAAAAAFRIGPVDGLLMPRRRPGIGEESWSAPMG